MPRRQRPPDDAPAAVAGATSASNSADAAVVPAEPEPKVRSDLAKIMTNDGRTLHIQQQTVMDGVSWVETFSGAVALGPGETQVVLRMDVPASAVSLALALSNRIAYLGRMTEASVGLERTAMVMHQLQVYSPRQLCDLAQATAVLGSHKLTSLVHSALMSRILEAPGVFGPSGPGALVAAAVSVHASAAASQTPAAVVGSAPAAMPAVPSESCPEAASGALDAAAASLPGTVSAQATDSSYSSQDACGTANNKSDALPHTQGGEQPTTGTKPPLTALDDVLQHAVSKGVLSPQVAAAATSTVTHTTAASSGEDRQQHIPASLAARLAGENTPPSSSVGAPPDGTTDSLMLDSSRKLQEAKESASSASYAAGEEEGGVGTGVRAFVDGGEIDSGDESPHHHDHLLSVFSHGHDVSDIIRSAAAERDITPPMDTSGPSTDKLSGSHSTAAKTTATEQTSAAMAAPSSPVVSKGGEGGGGWYGECPPGSDPLAWRIAQHVEMERVLGPLELPNLDDLLYRPMGAIAPRGGEGGGSSDDSPRGAAQASGGPPPKQKRRGGKKRGGKNKGGNTGGASDGGVEGAQLSSAVAASVGADAIPAAQPASQTPQQRPERAEFPLRGAELRAALARGEVSLHDEQVEALFHPSRYED